MERHFSADVLAADVLADILLRLPPSSRRRARLVCRHWRDVVNERTTEMQSRPKLLIWNINYGIAYVSDDLSSTLSTGSCTELWSYQRPYYALQLVGTCNGLLCLCDNEIFGGAIMLANLATGETLPVEPLCAPITLYGMGKWGDAYSLAYHPITGRYKVVHVPCSYEWLHQFDTVHVLTLGETTWREVPAGPYGAMCNLAAGIVSIDGATYWVSVAYYGVPQIVVFDLMEERVISDTIPVPVRRSDNYRISEVHGRLGYVTCHDVWVLEEGRWWSHRYKFTQDIPRPHFVYGEYMLTSNGLTFYGHRPERAPSSGQKLTCGHAVRVDHEGKGTLVANMPPEPVRGFNSNYLTFAYIETTEPLGIYASKSVN